MFGQQQLEHDERYAVSHEWAQLYELLLTTRNEFNFDGDYFPATGVVSAPGPIQRPRPPIMSAGSSPAGRDFPPHMRISVLLSVATLMNSE